MPMTYLIITMAVIYVGWETDTKHLQSHVQSIHSAFHMQFCKGSTLGEALLVRKFSIPHSHPQYINSAQQNTWLAAFLNDFMYDDPENKACNSKAHVRIAEIFW